VLRSLRRACDGVAERHGRRAAGAPKALAVALSFCRLLGLGCPKQAFAKIATPRLFGHDKGAYTDAKRHQLGLIAQSDGGTLFLDEIEALSPKGQVCLLRFTEDQHYKPLGSTKNRAADVRIIAASNAPLSELTTRGCFRQDLFFRFNVITLELPALRERKSDIPCLVEHFMQKFRVRYSQPNKQLSQETISWMQHQAWPGNVRELENCIHRAFLLDDCAVPDETCISEPEYSNREQRKFPNHRREVCGRPFQEAKKEVIDQFERDYLLEILAETKGNVTLAAKLAGKERRAFGKLLIKHDINAQRYRPHY
jgi:DNA-binding NtrC family response regulator